MVLFVVLELRAKCLFRGEKRERWWRLTDWCLLVKRDSDRDFCLLDNKREGDEWGM